MEEIPGSKCDIKLFRRYPDEINREKDYGPGYIKLYKTAVKAHVSSLEDTNSGEVEKDRQIFLLTLVFRNSGIMKVRAAHELCSARVLELFDLDNEKDDDDTGRYEVRYTAIGDRADMAPGSSGVYGQAKIIGPIDFPLAFEFYTQEARDGFVAIVRENSPQPNNDGHVVESPCSFNTKRTESSLSCQNSNALSLSSEGKDTPDNEAMTITKQETDPRTKAPDQRCAEKE